MNRVLDSTSIVLLVLLSIPVSGQAQQNLLVMDRGTDGNVRYYSVVCPNGKRTSVSNNFAEGKICTMAVNTLETFCRQGWDIDSAAKTACN